MSGFLTLIVILYLIYKERSLFKIQSEELYKKHFFTPPRTAILALILMVLVSIISDDKLSEVSAIVLVCYLPYYLIQRHRYKLSIKALELVKKFSEEDQLRLISYGIILKWIFCLVVISAVIEILMEVTEVFNSDLSAMVFSAVISFIVLICFIYQASTRSPHKGFLHTVGIKRHEKIPLRHIIIPGFLGLGFAAISSCIIVFRQNQPITPLSEALESVSSSSVILGFLIVAVLFAPLVEEIIFRGYFFYVLKKLKGEMFAIIGIGAIFGILHMNQYWGDWLAIVIVMLLGFVLTIVRAKTGRTVSSIIMHYIYNAGVVIIPFIITYALNPAYFQYVAMYDQLTPNEKEELLVKSISINPELSHAYNNLAWLYTEEERNLEEAMILIDKALAMDDDYPAFWDTKAVILEKLGREEEAEKIWLLLEKKGDL